MWCGEPEGLESDAPLDRCRCFGECFGLLLQTGIKRLQDRRLWGGKWGQLLLTLLCNVAFVLEQP